MRVAVVAAESGPAATADDAERTRELVERLRDRGHPVRLFTPRWWEGDIVDWEWDGLEYRAVTNGPAAPDRRFITGLPPGLRSFGPDVIHVNASHPAPVHAAVIAARLLRLPVVADWYDLTPQDGWAELSRELAARTPDGIVTPSRLVRTGIRALGGSEDRVSVIPTPIDYDLIRSTSADRVADIVYARRLDESANLESLFLALAELRRTDWDAAVIGDGPDKAYFEEQAADLRIDDRVTFLGDLSEERRVAIYKGAHVAIHTAWRAPFAVEFLRALACGCVGIAEYHERSSAHELIEGWDRGIRTTGEEELADAIRDAADMDRREVEDEFAEYGVDAVLDRYLECYRSVGATAE